MKAKILTFVRGLKNGTPPRFQSYLKSLTILLGLMLSVNVWGAETEVTSVASIKDGGTYYIKGVRSSTTYYLSFDDATGSQSGTESSTKDGAIAVTFNKVSNGVYTLKTPKGNYIAPGTSNGKINVSETAINVTATDQSQKIRLSIVSGTNSWSIQKNTGAANFGGYKNTQSDITLIEAAAKTPTTITLSEAGEATTVSGTHYVGDKYTLPSTCSQTCGDKTFVGWSTIAISTPSATKPTSNYYDKGEEVTLSAENTFYAVFADASEGGEEIVETVGFESSEGYTATNTYNSSNYTTGSSGSKWTINYGAFATSGAIVGSQSAQFRIYSSGGGYGQLYNSVAYTKDITKVVFSAKTANTNGQVKVSYSTNKSSWTDIETKSLTTTITEYTVTVPVSGVKYIKFTAAGTKPGSSNYSIYVDAVKIYSSGGTTFSNYTTTCGSPVPPEFIVTAKSNNVVYGTVSGTTTITATPNAGYRINVTNPYSISPSGAATVTQNGNTFSVSNVTADCEVTVNFEAIPKHKVFFSANETIVNPDGTEYAEGAAITFPETATGCYGKTFTGWYGSNYSNPTTAPAYVTSATMGTDNITYYAVFAEEGVSDRFYMYYKNGDSKLYVGGKGSDASLKVASSQATAVPFHIDQDSEGNEILRFTHNGKDTIVTHSSSGNTSVNISSTTAFLTITKNDDGTIKLHSQAQSTRYFGMNGDKTKFYFPASEWTLNWEPAISYANYSTTCEAVYEAAVATGITHGSVLISKTDDAAAGAASLTGLHEGDKVYIFPTANTGYKLDAVTVNETPISAQSGKYSYKIGTEGITVSATFTAATYQISYNLDGGVWVDESKVAKTYTYGTGATLPTADDVMKADNTFLGWFLNNTGEEPTTVIGTTETGNKSFTARWLASGSKNVTINGDGKLTYTPFKPTTVNKDAENLTIDYSIEKGYTISTVTVTVDGNALTEEGEVVFTDAQLVITPKNGFSGDVTIAFILMNKEFTVTWMANKTQFKQEQIQEGSKVTLPTTNPIDVTSGEDTYKFQGWFTEEQYSNETDAPAYITNNTIEPAGDVTYYAVYAIVEKTPSTTTYTRVTEESQLQTASSLVIVNNSASKLFTNALGTATAPTESNGEITVNNTDMWSLSYANSKYTISNASGTLGAATMPSETKGNYNKPMSITSSNNSWTIAESGTDLFVLKNANNVGIEYYSSNWVVYINGNIAGVEACAHKLYIPKMINTYKNYRTRVAVIDHIAVNGTPVETKFVAGESFDATGLTIDVYYKDEDAPTNVTEGFTYAPTGALKTTDENITFTYQGKTVDLTISVSNTVSKIEVTTNPTKMEYTEGEQFNPEGMEVTATYDNEAKRVVTGYTYTPTGDLALGDKITISFGGQTTELGITINEAQKTTVNWFVEGVKLTEGGQSTAVIPGKKITVLPTEPEACQGNQFMGWTTQETYYNATTAPSPLFKTLADAPVVGESETNYYAVFAQVTATPVAESTVYTSNISDITGKKVKIADTEYDAIQLGTSSTHIGTKNITVPAGTTTLTLHAASWNNSSDVTLTASTDVAGVTIIPATAVDLVENTGLSSSSPWTITPDNTHEFFTFTLSGVKEATSIKFENNNEERVVIWGVNASTTITSDYSTTCLAALAAPTISTTEGEYCGSVDVVITQPAGNPEGAKIMYSTDNTNWNEYTAAVKLEASGTIYAKVVKDPKSTEVVSATYTVYPAYTLAQAATAAADASQIACLTFTDLLVQARSQSEAFLKASDGQIVLLNKYNHGLSVGDKLVATDAHVTFVKAHDLLQLTSTEGIAAATTGNATTPEEKAITALVAADYGKLVKIMNVTYDATNKKFTDASSNEIAVDGKFFPSGIPTSWPDGGKFNATGIVLTDGDNVVIAPRNTDDLESLAMPLLAPTNFAVASVNSYQASYSWTAVDGNAGYTLYIYDGDNEIYKSTAIGKTRTDYAPTKVLEANHAYTAKLVALGDKVEHSDSPAAEVGFTTNPNAKLNWYKGGSLYQTTYASQEKVVLPETDPTSPCPTNYENFVTWYTEEIDGQTTALDAAKKVKAGDAAASATTEQVYNFYAVFGKIKTQGTDKYVKVTEAQDNWKGEYLIGYDEGEGKESLTVFDGSRPYDGEPLDDGWNIKTITFDTDGSIKAADGQAYQFTFNVIEGNTISICSASNYYISNTTAENKLSSDDSKVLKNTISWEENSSLEIASAENQTQTRLCFNPGSGTSSDMRFRYYKNTSYNANLILYKRTTTNPQYSGYITTCPQTYTITIAENTKGLVEAATTTEILEGAKVLLTANAYAGYTKTGGNWIVKNTTTGDVVENLVGNTNYLTMPDYDVTIDYDFQEIKDQFVDNLHGNTTIEKGGADYDLPVLSDFSGETGKPSDNFKKFIGWSATSYDSGEPATEQPTILEGNQTATGATYFAVWYNQSNKYITEYCQTSAPANLHLVEEYHKATSVRIDWNNVTGADMYHIIVMDGGANIIADADVTESLYDLSGLTPGATYICTVKAHKDCWSDETEEFEFTTKENIQSYAVTINAEGGTYTIDPELEDGKIQEGATVTITNIAVTDATTHFFKELTVPEATDLTEITGGYKFTMPGKAVTINIVFAEYPKVTWKMVGQADVVTSSVRQDNKFVVGTVQSAPADWKYKTYFPEFAGWVTADKCDAEGNVETAEFVSATTEVPADGLTVYGAVAKSASADMSNTTKVTSNANLDMKAHYVIGGENNSTKYFYSSYSSVDVDESWGIGSSSNAIVFTISGSAEALVLQDKVGNYFVATGNKKNKMSTTEGPIILDETGNIKGTSVYYRFNATGIDNTNPGFRWYTSNITCEQAYLYKVGLIYENLTIDPQPDYGRTDLMVGNYGTVCVPYTVTAADRSGATFWNIETSSTPGYTNPTSITIVEETEDLEAGKPYIFCATSNTMSMFFSGDKYTETTSVAANGLYGNLTDANITINDLSDPDAGAEPEHGYFFVLQQKLYECGWNCTVSPNRGWVQATEITDQSAQMPPAAPRRVIGNPNVAPTSIDNLNSEGWVEMTGAHKYFRNGTIMIVNDGHIYNAQGIKIQ